MEYTLRHVQDGVHLTKLHCAMYIAETNILKSEMTKHYITDLGWFGLAWLDFDTSKIYPTKRLASLCARKMAPRIIHTHHHTSQFSDVLDLDTCLTPEEENWTGSNHSLQLSVLVGSQPTMLASGMRGATKSAARATSREQGVLNWSDSKA